MTRRRHVDCPECGGRATLTTGAAVYPHRPDLADKYIWRCSCGARCGCHPNSKRPLGTLANEATRKARSAAHGAFDPIWKQHGSITRDNAYAHLARRMGLTKDECHIGMMTEAQAVKVVEICKEGLI